MTDHPKGAGKRRRGIYILPNLLTTAALFAGFYAIVQAMNGQFELAAVGIFVAMVLDALDGRVARLTHTESDFGKEYDSLSDMVSFGLAPALAVYEWALSGMGKLGWLVAFVYAAAAALRLARFNTQVKQVDSRFFRGLPSPAAAGLVTGMMWVFSSYGIPGREISIVALVFMALAGGAMVSNIRYHAYKHINLKGRVPFIAVLAVVVVFVLISLDPPQVLFGVFLLYALSGPLLAAVPLYRRLRGRRPSGSGRL